MDNIEKVKEYKDKLKVFKDKYNALEREKLVIETNIENKLKQKEELINEIKESGFDPESLDEVISSLNKEIDNIIGSIELTLDLNNF